METVADEERLRFNDELQRRALRPKGGRAMNCRKQSFAIIPYSAQYFCHCFAGGKYGNIQGAR
jgi:hypothetical protein